MDKKPTKEHILNNHYVGFPEDIREKIKKLENMGLKRIVFWLIESDFEDPLEVFAKRVM